MNTSPELRSDDSHPFYWWLAGKAFIGLSLAAGHALVRALRRREKVQAALIGLAWVAGLVIYQEWRNS